MVHEYYTASQTFLCLLNRTTGIRPNLPPPIYDLPTLPFQPLPPPPPDTDEAVAAPTVASTVKLPALPLPELEAVESRHLKERRRTDSAFESVLAHKDPILPEDLVDEEMEGLVEDCVVDEWEDADLSWSDEAPSLKSTYYTLRHAPVTSFSPIPSHPTTTTPRFTTFSTPTLFTTIQTLRLHAQKIKWIDARMRKFENLKELSLTGNFVESVDGACLPKGLEVLYLNANCLTSFPHLPTLTNLVHLSLSHNNITTLFPPSSASISTTSPSKARSFPWLPPKLLSLDVGWNLLNRMSEVEELVKSAGVRCIWLAGNPLSLLPSYHHRTILASNSLMSLDDMPITRAERGVAAASVAAAAVSSGVDIDKEISLYIRITTLTSPPHPIAESPPEPDQPPDETHYAIDIHLPSNDTHRISTSAIPYTDPTQASIDFNFATTAVLGIGKRVRDAIADGIPIRLMKRRITYVPRAPTAEGVAATDAKPAAAAPKAAAGRRASNAAAGGKGGAAKKGKKGKDEGDGTEYAPVVAEVLEVGNGVVCLKAFLEGQTPPASASTAQHRPGAKALLDEEVSGGQATFQA
ncbi:Leucine-rich repeat-containing protein 43 [Rhizophlyctis rosea]|nr:Leucine-rich repeat-containing protein 43 [Rhizophlyctis rosea]